MSYRAIKVKFKNNSIKTFFNFYWTKFYYILLKKNLKEFIVFWKEDKFSGIISLQIIYLIICCHREYLIVLDGSMVISVVILYKMLWISSIKELGAQHIFPLYWVWLVLFRSSTIIKSQTFTIDTIPIFDCSWWIHGYIRSDII